MSLVEWNYYWPDRGETREDARVTQASSYWEVDRVALEIAAKDYPKSDHWEEETIVLWSTEGEYRGMYTLQLYATPSVDFSTKILVEDTALDTDE